MHVHKLQCCYTYSSSTVEQCSINNGDNCSIVPGYAMTAYRNRQYSNKHSTLLLKYQHIRGGPAFWQARLDAMVLATLGWFLLEYLLSPVRSISLHQSKSFVLPTIFFAAVHCSGEVSFSHNRLLFKINICLFQN